MYTEQSCYEHKIMVYHTKINIIQNSLKKIKKNESISLHHSSHTELY